jgi:[ribosomal protein S18]-alanine N-acetyltransferase
MEKEMRVRYVVEQMTMADIPRVIAIEKLAYSSPWPSSAYRKELQENRYAHYIVARDTLVRSTDGPAVVPSGPPRRHFPLSLLPSHQSGPSPAPALASIIGFAGLWLMVDEAHITTIAVHPDNRGRGVGELMLGSLIDIAYEIGARNVTLEVRITNHVAQNLYRKYGFREAGVRRRYYSDNHEDALIMWTPAIHDPAYRQQFLRLKAVLSARLQSEDERSVPGSADAHTVGDPRSGQR